MSYPAAKALPLVGVRALVEIFFINKGGDVEIGATAGAWAEVSVLDMIFGRLATGELGIE